MSFWPFKNSDHQTVNEAPKTEILTGSASQLHAVGEKFQVFMKNNLPVGFEKKLNGIQPYILASFVAWPLYWMYRGLEWNIHKENIKLPVYIQKTYFQAKFLQFSLIIVGLSMASLMERRENQFGLNATNQRHSER